MSIQFDVSKVAMFREAQLANEDTMTRLDGNGHVVSNGQYLGFKSWRTRTSDDRAVNNAVRTELLKALAQAFNIKEGIREEDGKVKFSRAFMERLEGILGRKVLKTYDFEVGDEGVVKSGKPLTKRRITAILNKAMMAYRTNFDVDIYMAKLETIKRELGMGPIPPKKNGEDHFAKTGKNLFWVVEKGLNLLKNDIFLAKTIIDKNTGKPKTVFGPKEEPKDRSFMRVCPGWVDAIDSNMDPKSFGYTPFELRTPDGRYVPFEKPDRDEMLKELMAHEVIHIEEQRISEDDLNSMERQKKYIAGTVQQFVQKMIDTYFEAKAAGKLNAFISHLNVPGACLEEKCKRLESFRDANLNDDVAPEQKLSPQQIAEFTRIAEEKVGKAGTSPEAHDLIYGVINALYSTDNAYAGTSDWKDFSAHAKEKLIGRTAQIVRPVLDEARNEYRFVPVMDIDDKPVVRPLTAEDIDEIGRACLYNTIGGGDDEE